MKGFLIALAAIILVLLSILSAMAYLDSEPPKDAEFTYARIRYHMTPDAIFQREVPWHHELNDKDVTNFRQYLERGGFVMVDDFRGERHLSNLVHQMKKVLPNREIIPLTLRNSIFDSFYKIESLDMAPPYGSQPVQFLGIEDDHGRLMM